MLNICEITFLLNKYCTSYFSKWVIWFTFQMPKNKIILNDVFMYFDVPLGRESHFFSRQKSDTNGCPLGDTYMGKIST